MKILTNEAIRNMFICHPKAHSVISPRGRFYCLTHGQEGRGRWQYRIPLAVREFPYIDGQNSMDLDGDYNLIPLNKKDARNNDLYLLTRAKEPDNKTLFLWNLFPGYRGSAIYEVQGQAKILALGQKAQGDAGRMGKADCPIVLVEGPCIFLWRRTGRLYGEPSKWVIRYDGETWSVGPADSFVVEEAAFNY